MESSSSRVSQIKWIVFVCLSLISQYESIETKTVSDYASSYAVASSSSSALQIEHDIFVSFRGSDIRKGLLSHLILAFSRKQIVAFVDDKLERGQEISEALLGAIERSLISLVIFSEDYASSHWCLEELVKIVECREKYGQIVIPVFYNVDPSDVRNQKGTYGNAFAEHERKYNETEVQTWRYALRGSANLSGFHSINFRNDAELIEEIIKFVKINLNHMHQVRSNGTGIIGIDKPIAHLESLLHQKSEDVRVIGIWGMGGIGKTTLAEEVFNRLCSEYQSCCFLAHVREESKRHGLIYLKRKLFSNLLDEENLKIETPNGLPSYVEKRLGRMKVLIVLDDVNDAEQIEILVGTHAWFGSGSRIIATTRDKQVLVKEVHDIYEVKALKFDEALQLFTLHAFKQNHLQMQYYELSKSVVNYAKGIPLVLKVLGHLLHRKDKEIWESQLEKLKKMPIKKVHDIMRLSYDDLDREEKKIFLDIACFFSRLKLKVPYLKSALKDDDYSVAVGLERLKDMTLITISEENIVSVHDIIQEMAWEIVRHESIEDPGKHSRIQDPNDIYQVFKQDMVTKAIRSIAVNLSQIEEMKLRPQVFAEMNQLKFLDFYGENQDGLTFPQGLQSLPNELRYLRWMDYPLKYLPEKFPLETIVILDLRYSIALEKLWHGVQNLVNLKVIKLYNSSRLMELPDFSKATNLEVIDVGYCGRLTKVHPSVFFLKKLVELDLSWSISLTSLRSDIHLSSLRYLNLEGCTSLKEFAVTSENMVELSLQGTSINTLSSSIGRQNKLEKLHLAFSGIVSLPAIMNHLLRLKYLDLRGCKKLQTLPELPSFIETVYADDCVSLRKVLFPSTIDEQLRENKRRLTFWNCLKLDQHSLKAIGSNVQINVMKFAHQQLEQDHVKESHEQSLVTQSIVSKEWHMTKATPVWKGVTESPVLNMSSFSLAQVILALSNTESNMLEDDGDAKATYVYPGSSVPEWLEYRTTKNYITINLSSSSPYASRIGFIFCFIVPKVQSLAYLLSFNITDDDSSIVFTHRAPKRVELDHVCVMYDQKVSRFLNSRARNRSRLKINVTAASLSEHLVLKGLGVHPIYSPDYHIFTQFKHTQTHWLT